MPKRRPNGDGAVRKRAYGRWEGSIVVGHKENGKPIFKSVFAKTQKEVTGMLHRLIEIYRDAELTEDSKIQLSEWLYRWLNEYKVGSIRESTRKSYESYIRVHINPRLGDKQISAISTADVQKMYNAIKQNGRKGGGLLSDSTVRRCHMMLHEALQAAVGERLIVSNPTNGTTVPGKTYTPKRILNKEQLETFIEAIKSDDMWHDFFYTEITTGLRRGEICGLKWSDLDESTGKLKIQRSVSNAPGGVPAVGETKRKPEHALFCYRAVRSKC